MRMNKVQKIAREICRAACNDCVMDTDRDRRLCTLKNCHMMPIAALALRKAQDRLKGKLDS